MPAPGTAGFQYGGDGVGKRQSTVKIADHGAGWKRTSLLHVSDLADDGRSVDHQRGAGFGNASEIYSLHVFIVPCMKSPGKFLYIAKSANAIVGLRHAAETE